MSNYLSFCREMVGWLGCNILHAAIVGAIASVVIVKVGGYIVSQFEERGMSPTTEWLILMSFIVMTFIISLLFLYNIPGLIGE